VDSEVESKEDSKRGSNLPSRHCPQKAVAAQAAIAAVEQAYFS
jgi:hypothetical protein